MSDAHLLELIGKLQREIAVLKLRVTVQDDVIARLTVRVMDTEFCAGLEMADPEQVGEILTRKAAAEEQRIAFNDQHPENPL